MVLKRVYRKKNARLEYALISKKNPKKVLFWFGKKPSRKEFIAQEKRIQFFKHFSSNVNVRAHIRKGKYVKRHLRKVRPKTNRINYGSSPKMVFIKYTDKEKEYFKELGIPVSSEGYWIRKSVSDAIDKEEKENFSSRPQGIGTSWKGKKFIHGKRQRRPLEFSTLWTMKPSEVKTKFHKKLPKLPKGSKIIIGPLKKGGIEIQSYLKPLKNDRIRKL